MSCCPGRPVSPPRTAMTGPGGSFCMPWRGCSSAS
nr:MAG TPA: hypothetical protein [Caudoviricetes sp.]